MKMFHLSVHLLFLVCILGGCWRKPEPLTRPFFRSPVGRVFLAYSVTVDLDDSADWYLTEYTQWAFFVFYMYDVTKCPVFSAKSFGL